MNSITVTIIVSVAAAILYLIVAGVAVKKRGFGERTTRLLLSCAIGASIWELGRALSHLQWLTFLPDGVPARIPLYGAILLSVLFLHLTRSFLRLEGAGWTWWGVGGVWIAALIVLDADLLGLPDVLWTSPDGQLIERQGLTLGILALGWLVFAGGALVLTALTYRRTQQPLHRNRITYWFLALGLAIVGAGLLVAGQEALSSGAYLLSVFSAAYVVLTHRLFDVRQIVCQAASYLITIPLTLALYTGSFLIAYNLLQTIPGYTPLLGGLVMATVITLLFNPLLRAVQHRVRRLITGTAPDPRRTLREYSAGISNILDLERLATVAVGLISEAMEIQRGALFVVNPSGEGQPHEGRAAYFRLRGIKGMGETDPPPVDLPAGGAVAQHLSQAHTPLTQYDADLLPSFQHISPGERNWLTQLDMDVYVPIYSQGMWIGLLALGPKRSGDRYFDDELELLSTLADQTAVALENARLFDNLKARNVEIEQLNQELANANRELTRLGQTKSDFIDIASHELRTPLTQVRGYTDILREMIEEKSLNIEAAEKMTSGLKKAAHRLEEIVDTMFDVAKLDTETMTLNWVRSSINSILRSAIKMWKPALEERHITLRLEGLDDLPPVLADYKRMGQAFSHVIQNAIKFTPDGGEIRITGQMREWTQLADRSLEIIVSDSGIGIDATNLELIFDRFYRGSNVLQHSTGRIKFKGAGPGLGLTVARGIIEAHGGRIWAESLGYDEQACPGSQFHIVLPIDPRHGDLIQQEARAKKPGSTRIRGGKFRSSR